MNFLKLVTLVAFTVYFAQTVHSKEINGNMAVNTEIAATYMVDAETTVTTINPEFSYTGLGSLELTAGTTLNLWENEGEKSSIGDELDHLPVLEFGLTYVVNDNFDIEVGFDYDLETEDRGDIRLVAAFKF